jgi:hypothetical protein
MLFSCVGRLLFQTSVHFRHRTAEVGNRPNLNLRAVIQNGARLRQSQRLIYRAGRQPELTRYGFFGLGKHTIGNSYSFRPGKDLSFLNERLCASIDPALVQIFYPGVKVCHHSLQFRRG